MFGNVGMPELLVIFTIALLVFGPRRLPELGRSLGRTLSEFRRATNEFSQALEREVNEEERRQATIHRTSGQDRRPVPHAPSQPAPGGQDDTAGSTRDSAASG